MLQATVSFFTKNAILPPPLSFFLLTRNGLLEETAYPSHQKNQGKVPALALFLDDRIRQSKNIADAIMLLFMAPISFFDCDAIGKRIEWKAKAQVLEKHSFVKIKQKFSLVESSCSNKIFLYENGLPHTMRK